VEELNDKLQYAIWFIENKVMEKNASKLIETDESLHHNRRETFRTFTVKKDVSK